MDNVSKTEVLLNILNMVLTKALYFKDNVSIKKLSDLRHAIYYGEFNYNVTLNSLREIEGNLSKYE